MTPVKSKPTAEKLFGKPAWLRVLPETWDEVDAINRAFPAKEKMLESQLLRAAVYLGLRAMATRHLSPSEIYSIAQRGADAYEVTAVRK